MSKRNAKKRVRKLDVSAVEEVFFNLLIRVVPHIVVCMKFLRVSY